MSEESANPAPSDSKETAPTDLATELKAMGTVSDAFSSLDDSSRQRVVTWVIDRFGLVAQSKAKSQASKPNGAKSEDEAESDDGSPPAYGSVSELYDAATPKDGPERALVVGYWFQVLQSQENFSAQQVNDELKHMGHPLSNVTNTLTSLATRKPVLMRQVEKTGKSQQARKKYRLTTEGIKAVLSMIRGQGASE